MTHKRYIHIGWALLLAALLVGLLVTPVSAGSRTTRQKMLPSNTANIGATIYLSTTTLRSYFQNSLDQQIPSAVSSAISGLIGKLPQQDQGWAYEMATTLIQPSATLVSLAPQQGGLATTLRLSLYPGDPHPITSSILVSFSVANASTVQVSAHPLHGSPALVTGPLTSFHIPVGQLDGINTTPHCGDSALAVHVHFPVTVGPLPPAQGQSVLNGPLQARTSLTNYNMSAHQTTAGVPTYVEIPNSSLAAFGPAIGSWQIDSSLTAENIQIGTDGTNLFVSADIYLGTNFKLATARTTIAPAASGGNLAVHVLGTDVTIFQIFTFPYDTYNQQIEQALNSLMSGAFAGKFYITNAAVGSNAHISCAASDSLILTGTTSIG